MKMVINDEDAPEEVKIDFALMLTMRELRGSIISLTESAVMGKNTSLAEKKALLEYLTLVKAGIEQYKIHKTEE